VNLLEMPPFPQRPDYRRLANGPASSGYGVYEFWVFSALAEFQAR
jgi:hypothetical protein